MKSDERYVVMTVECPTCKTKQKVHVATCVGISQVAGQTVLCIGCSHHFTAMVTDKIIRGPFPL